MITVTVVNAAGEKSVFHTGDDIYSFIDDMYPKGIDGLTVTFQREGSDKVFSPVSAAVYKEVTPVADAGVEPVGEEPPPAPKRGKAKKGE